MAMANSLVVGNRRRGDGAVGGASELDAGARVGVPSMTIGHEGDSAMSDRTCCGSWHCCAMGIAAGAGSIGHTSVVGDTGVVGVSGVAGLAIGVSPPTSGDADLL